MRHLSLTPHFSEVFGSVTATETVLTVSDPLGTTSTIGGESRSGDGGLQRGETVKTVPKVVRCQTPHFSEVFAAVTLSSLINTSLQ